MKKYDKEVLQSKLDAEEKELKHLKAIYNKAADDISKKIEISNGKIKVLLANWDNLSDEEKSIYQSQIYQRNFQKSLKSQIDGFLKELNDKQYASITEYMKGCYTNGYLGAMYSIHQQGIPIISPIDQQKVVKAMFTDSKISEELYTKLGEDVSLLKKRIANNLSRGIATASAYKVIARNIAADSNVGFNRAMRIARTEGGRISNESAFEASNVAKGKGADVVGQWDAALDGRTRTSHRIVDGEIRELGEEFSNGLKFPCDPAGSAAEVINCRCALLQRAKWALDEDELQTLKDRAAYFGLDKTENFEDFKKKYLKAVENSENGGKMDVKKELQAIKERLNGKPASMHDLKEAGQIVKKHIGEYHLSDAEKECNDAYEQVKKMSDLIQNGKMKRGDEYRKAFQRWQEAKKSILNMEQTRAKWLCDAFSEIRQMGSEGLESEVAEHLSKSHSVVRKYVEDAYSFYPREWVEKSIARDKLTPKSVRRGYYSDARKEIAISGAGGSAFQTSIHELGHRFERVIPQIRDAEEEFYKHRTDGENLEWLGGGYRKNEKTRKDNFVNPYMGKDYGGSAYELVSMGFELAYTHPDILAKDPEMEAWIYGILSLY